MAKTCILTSALVLVIWGTIANAQVAPTDLETERERIQNEITTAEKLEAAYKAGAIKMLVSARLEILKLSLALIDQRRIGTATGAKVEPVIPASRPEPEKVAGIEREIRILDSKLASSQIEAQRAGGLMRGLLDSRVAAEQLSITMLQTELLKARYGIAWLSTNNSVAQTSGSSREILPSSVKPNKTDQELPRSVQLILPNVSDKHFRASDWRNGILEDGIYFDVIFATAGLPKATRAIKGAMVFADLFGEEKLRIGWTINAALTPGNAHQEKSVGMKYNQFKDSHTWFRSTELADMRIWFETKEIIYSDGTKESLE
jgi:hypothetical protein